MSETPMPADFASWLMVETVAELADRYGIGNNTVLRLIQRCSPEIRAARDVVIRERRGRAATISNRIQRQARDAADDEPVSKQSPQPNECRQRSADAAFVAAYAAAAGRNGWRVWE